jgi:hypothetical protein
MVVDFKSLACHCCRFESHQGLWIVSCEEAIQITYRRMLVVLLRCPVVLETMLGEAPKVFLHQLNWNEKRLLDNSFQKLLY